MLEFMKSWKSNEFLVGRLQPLVQKIKFVLMASKTFSHSLDLVLTFVGVSDRQCNGNCVGSRYQYNTYYIYNLDLGWEKYEKNCL